MWILVKPSVRINYPNSWIPYVRFPQSIWVLVTHPMTIGYRHYSSTFRTCALSCLTIYRLIYTYDHSEFTLIRMRVNSTTLVKTFCIYFQFPQIILLALTSSMWHFNRLLVSTIFFSIPSAYYQLHLLRQIKTLPMILLICITLSGTHWLLSHFVKFFTLYSVVLG